VKNTKPMPATMAKLPDDVEAGAAVEDGLGEVD
jgi:hypothetical protein